MLPPQDKQSLKRKHPGSIQPPTMPPLSSSSTFSTGGATEALAKRLREEVDDVKTAQKKRRVSLPCVPTKVTSAAKKEDIHRSKSLNEINASLSPVQLLKGFAILKSKLNNSKTFVKPSQEDLASYDTSVVNAIRSANLATLKSVHKEGKSLNACNQFGESLLHMACRRGNPEVVRYLVEEAKVNVAIRDDYGRTVLHDATWTSRPNFDVMEILLKAIDPEMLLAEDVRGHTPFDYARKEHWGAWVKFLKEREDKLSSPPTKDTMQITA